MALAPNKHDAAARNPRATVLMCVYNDEQYVGNAIKSILSQTFADFEFLIVNDGSTDGTLAILNSFQASDPRIRVVSYPNSGTTISGNRGLSLARGEYVARLDSDDISLPDRLAIEVDYLDRHPEVALVGGGSYIIDSDGKVIGRRNINPRNLKLALRSRCFFQQSDVMFRRELVLKLGGYRPKLRNAQDYDLWLRVSEVAEVAKLPNIIGMWRINPSGYTLARAAEQRFETALVRRLARERRHGGVDSYDRLEEYPAQLHRRSIAPSAHLTWLGSVMLKDGRRAEARLCLGQALRQQWTLRAFVAWLGTFSPRWVLEAVLRLRDAYLNYRFSW